MGSDDRPSRIDQVFADRRLIDEALAAAAADAVERHRRAGAPLVVFRDGRIERVPAERLVPNVEILLADTDFAQKRTAKELIAWYEERLSAIRGCLAARPSSMEHRGPFKTFMEELYPFVLWLRHLYADREDVICYLDSRANPHQAYDAVVEDHATKPATVTYVQLTTTAYDRTELLRMRELGNKGIAPAYGLPYVLISSTQAELLERVLAKIAQAVDRKKLSSYGEDHVLVVSFDDFIWFGTDDDRAALRSFVSERLAAWRLNVATLYIVGISGRTFESFPVPPR